MQGRSISPTLGLFCPCGSAPGRASDEKWLPAGSTKVQEDQSELFKHKHKDTRRVLYHAHCCLRQHYHHARIHSPNPERYCSFDVPLQSVFMLLNVPSMYDTVRWNCLWPVCLDRFCNQLLWNPSAQQTGATGWSNPFQTGWKCPVARTSRGTATSGLAAYKSPGS